MYLRAPGAAAGLFYTKVAAQRYNQTYVLLLLRWSCQQRRKVTSWLSSDSSTEKERMRSFQGALQNGSWYAEPGPTTSQSRCRKVSAFNEGSRNLAPLWLYEVTPHDRHDAKLLELHLHF